jgi:hypothetical protein
MPAMTRVSFRPLLLRLLTRCGRCLMRSMQVKIGNWVEERALIESAPGMCIPEWGDKDPETGAKIQWSNKMRKVCSTPPRIITSNRCKSR